MKKDGYSETLRWFKENSNRAKTSYYSEPQKIPPKGRSWTNRLSWSIVKHELDTGLQEGLITKILAEENKNVDWVFDTNFFITECDETFWKTLIKEKKKLLIPTEVIQELYYWLTEKKTNPLAAKYIEDNLSNPELIEIIDLPSKNEDILRGLQYYVNLLSLRKKYDIGIESYLKDRGSPHTTNDIGNFIVAKIGRRAKRLSREYQSAKQKSFHRNDEIIIWKTIVHALINKKETAIVTYDEGFLEQFYKSLWFLDTHYRSMLFSEILVKDPLRFKFSGSFKDKKREAFVGNIKTYKKESDELTELLPRYYNPVPIHCFHHKNKIVNSMSFNSETAMLHLIKTKGASDGNSTVRFGNMNCHICLGPLMQEFGNVAALAEDVKIDMMKDKMLVCRIGLLDYNLCVSQSEGFSIAKLTNLHSSKIKKISLANPIPRIFNINDHFNHLYFPLE